LEMREGAPKSRLTVSERRPGYWPSSVARILKGEHKVTFTVWPISVQSPLVIE